MLTRKDLYNYGARVYAVGYCGAQNLLAYTACEIGRNGGVYGWNWTAYKPAQSAAPLKKKKQKQKKEN